ncbi:4-hydroxyphenylacetate 3-hydroxylase N-terminal domain-containing protein [Streptomyces sp. MB09-01]|uniref:4-hydroxyphenylacetate 3-hydroxylase family protein n=1 Tax=Streptomyces sp. MB09-01 TaxID=3028666 RepID=UPI0029ABE0AE|nr:4-hydroxyphenylacetate 3-hydroxylase N-terminal domain-containing protein [Streptomyces sp. MB09-01]MDX3535887.1 4-hydroxyphenylacetate 3-hydroxylase N-terminal domain-containing protein [Streptomyces sp. MB09-01]
MSRPAPAQTRKAPLGVQTGDRYRASLDDGRELYLDGKRVTDPASHPAFKPSVDELGRLIDLQHDPEHAPLMTWKDPQSGLTLARAYQPTRTLEDLRTQRRSAEVWLRESLGQHGRSPAFMASIALGLYDFRHRLDASRPGFGANAEAWYRHCATNDLVLTHALGDPQIDRSADPVDDPDLALRVIEENDKGIVVRGAKQLTTLAPTAHEVLVYLSASFTQRRGEQFVVWCALPLNTPGLITLCREPFGAEPYGHEHPLAGRFDEQDAMLFFDDVLVPWDRVFLLRDGALARTGLGRINAWSAYIGHIRYRERLRTLLATATMLAESIGVEGFRNIQEELGKLASYAELTEYFIDAAEARATVTDSGLLAPGDTAASRVWSAEVAASALAVVRNIGSAGILMQPTPNDLDNPRLRPHLDRYMRGRNIEADKKSRLFRLAWDLTGDSFGQRQDLYEYVHRGDLARNRINIYKRQDQTEVRTRLEQLIAAPSARSAPTTADTSEGERP